MNKITCPRCGSQSPEVNVYCSNCTQILRCPHCKALLHETSARYCGQCVKPLPEPTADGSYAPAIDNLQQGNNRFRYSETKQGRKLEFEFTDTAIGHIGDWIPRLVGAQPLRAYNNPAADNEVEQGILDIHPDSPPTEAPASQPQLLAAPQQAATSATGESSPEEKIWRIFSKQPDGQLKQKIPDLRAAHETDYSIRLLHLFLYAHEVLGHDNVPRKEVYKILNEAGLKYNNYAPCISRDEAIIRQGGTHLSLNLGGREHAIRCIDEILNSEMKGKWFPGGESRTAGNSKKTAKRSSETPDEGDAAIATWVERTADLCKAVSHDAIIKLAPRDTGLLGLYGIRLASGPEHMASGRVVEKYLNKAFEFDAPLDSLRHHLKTAAVAAEKYVNYRKGVGYKITPTGCTYIQKLLNLTAPEGAITEVAGGHNGVEHP